MKTINVAELAEWKPKPMKQWKVTKDGLDTKDGKYFIAKDRLWETNHEWTWERHMADKEWVDMREFVEAITLAREKHIKFKPPK